LPFLFLFFIDLFYRVFGRFVRWGFKNILAHHRKCVFFSLFFSPPPSVVLLKVVFSRFWAFCKMGVQKHGEKNPQKSIYGSSQKMCLFFALFPPAPSVVLLEVVFSRFWAFRNSGVSCPPLRPADGSFGAFWVVLWLKSVNFHTGGAITKPVAIFRSGVI
jgi:hypothetical protein